MGEMDFQNNGATMTAGPMVRLDKRISDLLQHWSPLIARWSTASFAGEYASRLDKPQPVSHPLGLLPH